MSEPKTIQVKASDLLPYHHGIYCTVGGGEPFVNPIVVKRWSDDGTRVRVMLDTHNFDSWPRGEIVEVVELSPSETEKRLAAEDEAKFRDADPAFVMRGWHL